MTHSLCVKLSQGLASKHHDLTADHMIALLAMRDNMSKSKVKQVKYSWFMCVFCYHDVISPIFNILQVTILYLPCCYAYYFA